MYLTRNEKKREREGKREVPATEMSLFSKSFPSFSFFLPLFPLFRAPFSGDFFFFFCAKNVFRVTKRGVFFSSGVGRGEGVHFFFLSFWCEKTFCVHSFFFFFNENAFFLIIIIIIYIISCVSSSSSNNNNNRFIRTWCW